jgi:hypothetical protein
MTIEEMKRTLAILIDEQTDMTSNAVFADAQMELMDTDVHEPMTADDAFVLGYVLAAFLYRDSDGGVGPVADLPIPERTAF